MLIGCGAVGSAPLQIRWIPTTFVHPSFAILAIALIAEGEKEQKLFDAFMCYCKNGVGSLVTSIKDAEARCGDTWFLVLGNYREPFCHQLCPHWTLQARARCIQLLVRLHVFINLKVSGKSRKPYPKNQECDTPTKSLPRVLGGEIWQRQKIDLDPHLKRCEQTPKKNIPHNQHQTSPNG